MARFEVITHLGKSIFLNDKDEIQRGGEGRILLMSPNTGLVAKIYHQASKAIDLTRFNELQKLDSEYFIKPVDLLLQKGQPVGFTMKYAGADFFPISALFSSQFVFRNGIDDKFKKAIVQKLIDAVKSAHQAGFVIGDLNQFNVLVNLKGDLKFIDVDSYETSGFKHSGVLLDDIRDYYYQGKVSSQSDYFALSVLIFSILTYTHPFKGVHQKYKSLAERMVNKIPVFVDDPQLKTPKCYQPITYTEIQDEFNKFYLNGERFLFSIKEFAATTVIHKPLLKVPVEADSIKLQLIMDSDAIRSVYFGSNCGYIETDEQIKIYDCHEKGKLSPFAELKKTDYQYVYIGNKNIVMQKQNSFYFFNRSGKHIEIKNFKLPEKSIIQQFENILIVVGQGQMFWIYIDEILNDSIRNKRVEVFSESFSHHSGLIQNTGGIQRIFYNTGNEVASVKTGRFLKRVYQKGNVGIAQFIENNTVNNQYFKISGLNMEFLREKPENFIEFSYLSDNNGNGFIFEPGDNKMEIRRIADFQIVSEIPCPVVSVQSSLFYSKAGIVVWEKEKIFLVNQK